MVWVSSLQCPPGIANWLGLFFSFQGSTPGTHHHCHHIYVPVRLQSSIEGLCLRNILIKITYTTVNKTSIQVVVRLPTRCLYTALHGRNILNLLPGKALSFPRYCSFFLLVRTTLAHHRLRCIKTQGQMYHTFTTTHFHLLSLISIYFTKLSVGDCEL